VRWLSVLARAMQVRSQSTFLIERMQPTWLQRPWDVLRYKLLVRVLSGLGLGTVSFSLIIPVSGWWPGLVGGLAGLLMWALGWGRLRPWVLSICYGLAVGAAELSALPQLSTGYLLGFIGLAIAITGMGAWIAARQSNFSHIDVIPSLRWSWAQGLWAGLLAGLIGGIPAVVLISLLTKSWPTAFSAGGALGIVIGSQAGLAVGMAARELETSSQPNDGVRRTLRSALRAVAVASPVFGLVGVLLGVALHTIAEPLRQWPFPGLTNPWLTGLSGLISGGMAAFIGFGGLVALQHLVLRLVLYRAGLAPWNIAAFLDYCAERVLLRKVGGGYIFIHRTLLEYFAEGPEL
jgi:hypothetical protein